MSGHPFNGIITSLFIRARPGQYITSLRSGLAFCDKRPLLGEGERRRWGGWGLTCARWYHLTVCGWLSPKASSLDWIASCQNPKSTRSAAPCFSEWHRHLPMRPDDEEMSERGNEREREGEKGIYYSARPRPLHTRTIKNRKSIAETNGF